MRILVVGTRAAELAPLVRAQGGDVPPDRLGATDDEGFAQVLASDGSVLAATPAVAAEALIDPEEITGAGNSPSFLDRDEIEGLDGEPARLLVVWLRDHPSPGSRGRGLLGQSERVRPRELLWGVARRYAPRAAGEGRALTVDVGAREAIVGDRLRLE